MKSHKNKLLSSTVMAMVIGAGVSTGASIALASATSQPITGNADAVSHSTVGIQVATGCNPCNPCAAAKNPCNPCAAN